MATKSKSKQAPKVSKALPPDETSLAATLDNRRSMYGDFKDVAALTQRLERILRDCPNYEALDSDMRESLHMIMQKTSRIMCGDPYVTDSWHDIAGYAKLVEDRLVREGIGDV